LPEPSLLERNQQVLTFGILRLFHFMVTIRGFFARGAARSVHLLPRSNIMLCVEE
jgi:hypothetical protein